MESIKSHTLIYDFINRHSCRYENFPNLMKRLLLFLLFFSFAFSASGNAVDSLKTDNDVLKFVLKVDSNLTYKGESQVTIVPTDTLLKLIKCNDVARQWSVKAWQKVDFNRDGRTDLFVTLKWYNVFHVFVVIDKGDNLFKALDLTRGWLTGENCQLAWPIKVADKQMLAFYSRTYIYEGKVRDGEWKWRTELKTDTLVYLYDDFIEYNPKVKNYAIRSISINSRPTAWPGLEYTANIQADGKAAYSAFKFKSESGYFTGKISTDKLAELKSLLDYIQVKKLKDDYQVQWTDDQTVDYEIVFEDGTVKKINDYGTIGTFGLRRLYSFLLDLRQSEYWEPMRIPKSIPRVELPHVNKLH